ncbi:DNA polymerase I [Prevotella melaninogenica]|uniref:DNA polymerase n=1 Tax=Prevotella melaninogenica TaxID=28132 RepID=UPI001958F6ED|nr:DNA polymerase [Prevotella melaninogenica]VTY07964.1 DNA polymerase I [Prevotella melaninogenica]
MNKERIILILDSERIFEVNPNEEELKVIEFSPNTLIHSEILITFQSDQLINILNINRLKGIDILDFECLDKQIRQSLGLKSPNGKWSIANMIATYLNKEERKWQEEECNDLLKELALCYCKMKDCDEIEWKRVRDIELPVNRILYEVQANGVYFSQDFFSKCEELNQDLYSYKNKIQLEFNYPGDDLISYLDKHHIKHHLTKYSSDKEIKNFCKLHKLELFWDVKVTERNLKCLLTSSTVDNSNCCKPIFKGFASSTGRIFLRDPALQHLKKKFRIFMKEDLSPEWRYEYIDFGEFEAGILAGITHNIKLKKLYEKGGIYDELAQCIGTDRNIAKIYFYCFVYGGIISKGSESFFKKYNLDKAVEELENEALKQGYVTTLLGNKRVINDKEEDIRWILNHSIQGMSSLIFKQALINVNQTFREKVKLVLPIHDAALYKVHCNISSNDILNQFRNAFVKWIPEIKPVVNPKDFFKD